MKIGQLILLLILTIGIASCDCYISIKGKIISSSTGRPIEGVSIKVLNSSVQTISDSKGQFLLEEHTGFCYDPKVELTKNGYKPFRLDIASDSESVSYKVNTDSKSIDFDQPVQPDSQTLILSTWIDIYSHDFKIKEDSIIFYLDEDDLEKELKIIKQKLEKNG